MAAIESVKNVVYSGAGSSKTRIETVERTLTKSDDYERLGSLYYRMTDFQRQLENTVNADEIARINGRIADIEAEIAMYENYILGYDAGESGEEV